MSLETLYDERLGRIKKAVNNEKPDKVPVLALYEGYAVGYAGKTLKECLDDPKVENEAYAKLLQDAYFDGTFFAFLSHPVLVNRTLGSDSYFTSADGVTLQHKECCPMDWTDYEAFAADPYRFLFNEFFVRKYPNLTGSEAEVRETIKNSVLETLNYMKHSSETTEYMKQTCGMPVLAAGLSLSPLDFIYDFMRGLTKTIADVRRHPAELKKAIDATITLSTNFSVLGMPQMTEFPWAMTPLHLGPYLNDAQFEEFWWPAYKKYLMNVYEKGGHVCAFLEGKWGAAKIEKFKELPANFLILIIGEDDIVEAKKILNKHSCVVGGMRGDLLKFGTEQQCIDHAKYVLDNCAGDGGFMFCSNVELISPNDAKIENLRAVNSFVHEYSI